jgi:alpha-ketoglutarate-dependent taurine dioxygenase
MGLTHDRPAGAPLTVPVDGGDPGMFVAAHREELRALLLRHGAVLLRGLDWDDTEALATTRTALGAASASAREWFAARRDLGGQVYTTPEWEPEREMCLHHEQSHSVEFPRLLVFGCLRPADDGGATLLADTRSLARALPAALVDRFRRNGWRLVRSFRPFLGLPWATAFGTTDPAAVERYCADHLIEWSWSPDGTLHTRQRRPALVRHPVTGETCWFNQVAFFSQWSVEEAEREVLLESFGPDGLPFNTAYGDGTAIGAEEFAAVLRAADQALVRVRWQPGDVLLVDNVLTAHGREPYTGSRDVAVALGDPTSLPSPSPVV